MVDPQIRVKLRPLIDSTLFDAPYSLAQQAAFEFAPSNSTTVFQVENVVFIEMIQFERVFAKF